ncbi:MAG TPA: diacylglycerol kinase family protein [Actinomycetota bacterium]
MRLLLVANVRASSVTPRKIRFIHRALSSQADTDLVRTQRHGHGVELAGKAVADGYDVVAVLGGDGTINEVANGLAGTDVPLGVIPGGGTNVFARALGIPRDPVRAAGHLLALLHAPPRRINLGRAEGRYFVFTCGLGLDGAIVRRVERRQMLKRAAGHGYFVWSAFRELLAMDRRHPKVHARWGPELEHGRDGLFLAISQKGRPFTYLLSRPMHLCPEADFRGGIDLFAADRLGFAFVLKTVAATFGSHHHVRDRHVLVLHDQERVEVTCDEPQPAQMDGEYLGLRDRLSLEVARDALAVLA